MDNRRDWSGLVPELLVEIALRITVMEDFTTFTEVCSNWRAAGAVKAEMCKRLSKLPLLMLSEKDGSDEREFFSLSKNKIFKRMSVPKAKGQRCIGAGFGWTLAMSSSSSSVGVISLINLFPSSVKIELPNFTTFPEYDMHCINPDYFSILRGILSDNPSLTSNFTVFVIMNCALGFWRNGDKSWTKMADFNGYLGSLCSYRGKMYAVNEFFEIISWDPSDPTKSRVIMYWKYLSVRGHELIPYYESLPFVHEGTRMSYLVESSDGDLLVILRNNVDFTDKGATHFGVMKVDLEKMECKKIDGLGKDAVFLGENIATSIIAADFPGVIKPNCIYLTDDCWMVYNFQRPKDGGEDMGIYSVENGSIERLDIESFSLVSPPLWVFPSF